MTAKRKRAPVAVVKLDPRTGKYGFVLDLPPGPEGKRRQVRRKGFLSEDDGQAVLDKLRVEAREGNYRAPDKRTVREYLAGWLDALVVRGIRPATIESYRRNVEHYVIPRIGRRRLDQLSAGDLDAMYADLLTRGRRRREGGLSARSVRYVHTIVRRALADAVRRGELRANPADAASPPSAKAARAPEQRWWTPAEVASFLAATADDPLAPLFRLAATTGMRRGEVCALTWDDFDLDAGVVEVRAQLSVIAGKVVRSERPKTDHGRRRVDLDAKTVDVLRSHRARQAEQRLAVGSGWVDRLVFCGAFGEALDPEAVAKMFGRRAAAAGLPKIPFHGLRHSHTAALIASGQSPVAIAKRLGHASAAFSMTQYAHLLESAGPEAAEAAAALVDGAG